MLLIIMVIFLVAANTAITLANFSLQSASQAVFAKQFIGTDGDRRREADSPPGDWGDPHWLSPVRSLEFWV